MSRAASDPARAFALLSAAAQTLADSSDASVLYRMVEAALRELVGFRLFTLLRATPDLGAAGAAANTGSTANPPVEMWLIF